MKLKLLIAALFLFLSQPALATQQEYEECMILGTAESCAYLQCDPGDIGCYFTPAQFFSDPSSIVNAFLNNILLLAGIILFLLVVVAGFQMIQAGSSGDPHAMEKWRTMLMYGVIGFIIILAAGAVIKIIEVITGVNILNPEAVLNGS